MQATEGDTFIHRGDGDDERRKIGVGTVRDDVIGGGNRSRIVEGRGKGIGAIGIDEQRADPIQGACNPGWYADVVAPAVGEDGYPEGAVRVGAVGQQITADGLIFQRDRGLVQIVELIVWQKIVLLQRVLPRERIMAGIETCGGYGRITDTVDDDKTAITAGAGHTTNPTAATTRSRRTARRRRLEVLGRIDPFQYGFLQRGDFRGDILVLGR